MPHRFPVIGSRRFSYPAQRRVVCSVVPSNELPLTEPQRRRFAVILASLEDALVNIERQASDTAPDARRLTALEHDLPPDFAERAAPAIAVLRARLRALADAMHLETHHESRTRRIGAMLTSQMNQIQDSYARKLRGYGKVDPELAPRLDPVVEEMEAALADLRAMLRKR